MGAGSSKIESIQIEQEKSGTIEREVNVDSLAPKSENGTSEAPPAVETKQELSEVETLTKQLCESESQRLDLEDRVETLLKELEYVNSQSIANEERPCDETVHAKDQYISKLEKENAALETELNKMKQRQRKKQRQYNTQMAEYKQEANFQMMEMKDEISHLKAENKQLLAIKTENTAAPEPVEDDTLNLPGGEKMALILELSQQVTEQQDKIAKLEKKLKDKDETIEDLRKRMKNNAQYLSALNKFKEVKEDNVIGVKNKVSEDVDKTACSPKNHLWKGSGKEHIMVVTSSQKKEGAKLKKENNIDSLFTVDEESSDNEEQSMNKLSSLLRGVKADANKTSSRFDADSPLKTVGNGSVVYKEENNGRDSGLGSAGKRDEEFGESRSKKNSNEGYSWKDTSSLGESVSGLSDSDFEQYGLNHGKVASAPPKLQNSGGGRIKKKTGSLKRHVSSKKSDRPPPPNMAFVEKPETLGDDLFVNKLSPIYSPIS